MAESWERVLDGLEADLAALEARLGGTHLPMEPAALGVRPATWAPPSGLGPLPDHLLDRARTLEAAQARTALRLAEIRASAAGHLAALRAVPTAQPHSPVYVDVEG